uniref:Uncharacterized protein n=1 Tax=Nelumbo nucifera TaxID=4432 RepID=A0A822YNS9_NELNU|nr:TPA_asm: hypothetical protein HUJ06_011506 [Nelumbo nucifera]
MNYKVKWVRLNEVEVIRKKIISRPQKYESSFLNDTTLLLVMCQIDTSFDVWLLPSSRDNRSIQLPEIGGDDPSLSP